MTMFSNLLIDGVIAALIAVQAPPPPPTDRVVVPVTPGTAVVAPPAVELAPSTSRVTERTVATAPAQPPEEIRHKEVQVRILDLVEVEGARANQLQGVGLVTGLNGTGDKGNVSRQALVNFMLSKQMKVSLQDVDTGNVALVSVTCKLPPFAKLGTQVDVTAQSMNGATSLFGGTLLQTALEGADQQVYVVAQGAVTVGGFTVSGKAASSTQNHPTVGSLIGGGIVEQEVPMRLLAADGSVHLNLRTTSWVTATRVAAELRKAFNLDASAIDPTTIRVMLHASGPVAAVEFFASLADRMVAPADEAIVVINERTGTVVAGSHVRISTVAVTHGNLTISIAESEQVSQPAPFGAGDTEKVNRTDLNVDIEKRGLQVLEGGTSVSELAASLNRMGVAPRDLVSIFQALAQAGALHARLEIQ